MARSTGSTIIAGKEYSADAIAAIVAVLRGDKGAIVKALETLTPAFETASETLKSAQESYSAFKRDHDALVHAAGLASLPGGLAKSFPELAKQAAVKGK